MLKLFAPEPGISKWSKSTDHFLEKYYWIFDIVLQTSCKLNLLFHYRDILEQVIFLGSVIDVKVVMARLQILAKRRKWNPWIVSMTNTINCILKAEKIFQSKEWKIPTRFLKFWVALKPWHYYLLELWNKRKHCIVKEWLWLYRACKFTYPG